MAWLGSRLFGLPGFFLGALTGVMLMALISLRTFKRAVSNEIQLGEQLEVSGTLTGRQ